MIKLALTDLDDTLICHGHPRASDYAIEAIQAMIAEGLHFGPVSGRIPRDMGWMFDNHAECYATGAYCNGQMIYIDGELVREEQLDGDELNRLAEALTRSGRAVLTMFDVDKGDIHTAGYFVTDDDDHAAKMLSSFGLAKRYVHHLDKPAYTKANIHVLGTREEHTEVRDWLREEFPSMDFVFPSPTAPLIDISPHGWSKGSAVEVLASNLGIGLSEVATFGDSENDLSMIEGFPNAVAVSNATEQIKRAARWEIGASADDAVADALFDIAHAAPLGAMPTFMQG